MIDFTKPFMNLGISILFKKPEVRVAQLFRYTQRVADRERERERVAHRVVIKERERVQHRL